MSQYSVSLTLQVQQALQSLKSLTGNFKKVDKEVAATTRELEKFEKELKDESATIKNTISAQTEYINKLKGIQTGLDKSSAKFKAVSREITKFEANLKGGTTAVQGLTGAIAVLGAGAVLKRITGDVLELGKEFSAAEGSVKTLTGAAGFNDVQASIQKVSEASGGLTNRIEATAASYQLLSAGVSGAENIEKVLESSVALTTAGFTDQTTAVDALTTVINAYGLEADKAALLTDQLVQTQNDGKLTINEYGAALGKVIPTAATLGVGFAEVNAAIAGITLQGQNAEVATSGLNSALNKLAAPTKEGETILDKYKITVNAATIKADGLVGTLEKLQKVTSSQDKIKLFGSEAFKALGPLLNNFEKFKELVGNQAEASGVAEKAVKNLASAYSTLSTRNENLRKDVGVAVFEQLKPAIGAILVPINNMLAAFLQLPGPIKNVVIGLGLIVAAGVGLGLAAAAIGAMKLAILAATGATTLWAAATTLLGAAWSVIIGPIQLAVLAVVALIAGAVLLYNKFEPFKELVNAIGNEFKYWGGETIKIIKAIGAFAGVMIDNYIKGWKEFFRVVGKQWVGFTKFLSDGWNILVKILNFGWDIIKQKGAETLEDIKNFFSNAKNVVSNIWNALTGNVNEGTQSIGDITNQTTNGMMKAFGDAATWISGVWSSLMNKIARVAKQVLGGLNDFFKKAFNIDLMAGLNRAVEAAKKAFKGTGIPVPGTKKNNTKSVTTPDTPKDEQFDIGDVVGNDETKKATKTKAQNKLDKKKKEQEKLAAQQQKSARKIAETLTRQIQLNSQLKDDGTELSKLDKQRLQNGFDFIDQKKEILALTTLSVPEQEDLIKLAELRKQQKDRKALVESASDFPGFFAEAAKTDKKLNEELTTTQQLLKGSVDIITNSLQNGIKGLIDGTKSWGDILSDITGQLANLFISFAFKGLNAGIGDLLNFADGGRPPLNKPSIIGERGPELFVPDTAGTVISNEDAFGAARNAMGGAKNSSNDAFAENAESIGISTSYTKERVMERERIASINSNPIDVRAETTVINNVEYVTVEQFSQGMKSTARDAQAKVLSDLRNRPATRAQVGIR